QRLAIGLAMINDPDILFLDEPTTGLDPRATGNIWDIVLRLKELARTTILTTHYMEEGDKLSDRVCIADEGRVVAADTPQKLRQQLTKEREIELVFVQGEAAAEAAKEAAEQHSTVTKAQTDGARLQLWSVQPEVSLYHLFKFTSENQMEVEQITIRDMSLEDVFIAFTGKEWRD